MAKMNWNSEGYTVRYLCPQCKCSHTINVGIVDPGVPMWKFNGDFERPTLTPSVNIVGECHHYITDGFIHFCEQDTANTMKGMHELPDISE